MIKTGTKKSRGKDMTRKLNSVAVKISGKRISKKASRMNHRTTNTLGHTEASTQGLVARNISHQVTSKKFLRHQKQI